MLAVLNPISHRWQVLMLVAITLIMHSSFSQASQFPWSVEKANEAQPYSLLARDESLVDVLKAFANAYKTPVFVSEKVSGTVNAHYTDVSPRFLLDKLADVYNFNWYFDGSVLYFYRNDELDTRLIRLNYLRPSELKSDLQALGLWDHQYNWRQIPESGLIYLAGPPRMVEVIADTAKVLDQREKYRQEETYTLQFFPLKYASAHDSAMKFRQQKITIPGVATLLKRLVAGERAESAQQEGDEGGGVPKLKGKGINAVESSGSTEPSRLVNAGDRATIEADVRSNALVVYDLEARMPLYERLIEELDKPVDQIEINVSVINIRANKIKDLGISWRAGDSGSSAIFGFGDMPDGAEPDGNGIGLSVAENSLFSSVFDSGTSHLLARLNILAEKGDAQILSRPTVISTDNMEAILDNSSTFHVRVAGREEVDLFPISVGSVLKVTPHVIRDKGEPGVHLSINIEDGQQTQERVDNIPVIQNSTISTRAIVGENESLMIGGYYFDTKVESKTHVPVLSSIPVLGYLFKRTHTENTRMARLFMISPRILPRFGDKSKADVKKSVGFSSKAFEAPFPDAMTEEENAAFERMEKDHCQHQSHALLDQMPEGRKKLLGCDTLLNTEES